MKIQITGTDEFVILAETDHEQQWLSCLTNNWGREQATVTYTYPNYEPKSLNNPVVTIQIGNES